MGVKPKQILNESQAGLMNPAKGRNYLLTVDDEVEGGADLLSVVEGVADATGVVFDGVGEVGADDVQVARRGNHVVLAIWGGIVKHSVRRWVYSTCGAL